MQIIPTTSTSSLSDQYMNSMGFQAHDSSSFADEMARQQQARNDVSSGESRSVSVALENNPAPPLAVAPYSRNTTDNVTYTTEEVCFTKQELQELRQELVVAGAPPETLAEFDKLASQPDGATLAQILASLHQQRNYAKLEDTDIKTLQGLADKLDNTGALGSRIMGHINNQDGKKALEELAKAFGELQPGSRIEVDRAEMAALGKAMGLNDTSLKQLMGNFGSYSSVLLNKSDFDKFVAPAMNDFTQAENARKKLDKALDATLNTKISKAKARMEAENAASELSSRRAEQSKTLIQKTVLENVNEALEGARSAQVDQQGLKQGTDKNARVDMKDSKNAPDGTAIGQQDPLAAANAHIKQGQNQGSQHSKQDLNTTDHDSQKDKKDTKSVKKAGAGMEDLLDKTEVRVSKNTAPPTVPSQLTTPVIGITVPTTPGSNTLNGVMDNTNMNKLSQQALSQVEQSMLTAMKDGTKRLELQLTPGELGTLTVMLTARNGEVSATIRPERSETAEMLNRQLDMLRSTLEQQGIKVDKLEVQTQTPENNAGQQQWENMQQHNARQEENARRDTLDRLRNLGKIRNDSINADDSTLEQSMQSLRYTAGNAAQSLHIVA